MTEARIEAHGLVKRFGAIEAVAGLDVNAAEGEILGLLGPNGAGKTTTMRMLAGFLLPDAGRVRVCGHDAVEAPLALRRICGYLPEGAPLWPEMTPKTFLQFAARARGVRGKAYRQHRAALIEDMGIGDVMGQPIGTLSKGYRRRVALAQALIHDPPVLILDEPTEGLDPNQKRHMRGLITALATRKLILISTHILEEVAAICTRALIIGRGRLLVDGAPHRLVASSRYHNAVSITLARAREAAALASLARLAQREPCETHTQGAMTTITLFPQNTDDAAGFARDVQDLATQENWQVRALVIEPGRLDDLFHTLTRPDAAP